MFDGFQLHMIRPELIVRVAMGSLCLIGTSSSLGSDSMLGPDPSSKSKLVVSIEFLHQFWHWFLW